jgi:hypothetical protein
VSKNARNAQKIRRLRKMKVKPTKFYQEFKMDMAAFKLKMSMGMTTFRLDMATPKFKKGVIISGALVSAVLVGSFILKIVFGW